MKYKLKIIKVEEAIPNPKDRFMAEDQYEVSIFEANISPDGTIELMQHLWELNARENIYKKEA